MVKKLMVVKFFTGLLGRALTNNGKGPFNRTLWKYLLVLFFMAPFSVYALSNACQSLYPGDFSLIEGQSTVQTPNISKPGKGIHYLDQAFGSCVVRATDHNAEGIAGFVRSDYSRRQAFNADNSKFVVYASGGFWHLYNANTLAHEKNLLPAGGTQPQDGPGGDAELQWHPTNPDLIYYVPNNGGLAVYQLNVITNEVSVVGDFTGRLPWTNAARVWSGSEGSPSADGRYWGFMVQTNDFSGLGLIVWDMETDTIVSTWDFASHNIGSPDNVTMTPSGEYIIAMWGPSTVYGTTAFSRDFSRNYKVLNGYGHMDVALLPNGNDAFVAMDYGGGATDGDLIMIELPADGPAMAPISLYNSYVYDSGIYTTSGFHISAKAFNKPGWVLISSYGGTKSSTEQWTQEKLFAVELKENPRILNIAHHHSDTSSSDINSYWAQPHASVNRDFTKILFNSNWDLTASGDQGDIDAYIVELPESAIPPMSTDTQTAPIVTITAPADSASFTEGDTITFAGTANDAEDGDISGGLSWSSDRDGTIATSTASFTFSALSVGSHVITASVTDTGNLSDSASVNITITDGGSSNPGTHDFDNNSETPVSLSTYGFTSVIADGSDTLSVQNNHVSPIATLTEVALAPETLPSGDFTVSARLSSFKETYNYYTSPLILHLSTSDPWVGYGVTYVHDYSQGEWQLVRYDGIYTNVVVERSIAITEEFPAASELQHPNPPINVSLHKQGNTLTVDIGEISNAISFTATSGLPMFTGYGVRAQYPSVNSDIWLDDLSLNTLPTVTITSPANNSKFTVGDSITLTSTANDNEEGDISHTVTWSSSIDGPLGSGASLNSSTLSEGSHLITANVTDAGGLSAVATVSITVKPISHDFNNIPLSVYGFTSVTGDGADALAIQNSHVSPVATLTEVALAPEALPSGDFTVSARLSSFKETYHYYTSPPILYLGTSDPWVGYGVTYVHNYSQGEWQLVRYNGIYANVVVERSIAITEEFPAASELQHPNPVIKVSLRKQGDTLSVDIGEISNAISFTEAGGLPDFTGYGIRAQYPTLDEDIWLDDLNLTVGN